MFMVSREEVLSQILFHAVRRGRVDRNSDAWMRIVVSIEEQYGVELSHEDISKAKTAEELAARVVSKLDENDVNKVLGWFNN